MKTTYYKKEYESPEFIENKKLLEKMCKNGDVFLTSVYKEKDADGPKRTIAISFDYNNCFEREIRKRTGGVRGDLKDYTDWFIEKGPNTRTDKGEKAQTTYIDIKTDIMPTDSMMRDFNNDVLMNEEDLKRIHKWKLIKPYYERWLEAKKLSPLVTTLYEYMTIAKTEKYDTLLTEELVYTINDYGIYTVQELARYDYKKAKHAETFDNQMLLGEPEENLTERIVQAAAKWVANKQSGDVAVTRKQAPIVMDEKDREIQRLRDKIKIAGIEDEQDKKSMLPEDLSAEDIPLDVFYDSKAAKKLVETKTNDAPKQNTVPKAQKPTTNSGMEVKV